jgi:hypothetical protein
MQQWHGEATTALMHTPSPLQAALGGSDRQSEGFKACSKIFALLRVLVAFSAAMVLSLT